MRTTNLLLSCLGVATAVTAREQVHMGDERQSRYNLTLDFDDLETNSSGIGFDPWTSRQPLHYKDLYFQSFAVVNVAKALPSLPDPVDVLCARSAPNALFSSRRDGYVWPRFSLHNLTDVHQPRNPNITFNMRSLTLSPTGNIPGKVGEAIVSINLNLIKLPPDPPTKDFPPESQFPGLVRGSPSIPPGKHIYQLGVFVGPGTHPSFKLDFDTLRRYLPGYGRHVDAVEIYGELYRRNKDGQAFRAEGDWEVCLDDVEIEVVGRSGHATTVDEEEVVDSVFERSFVTVTADGTLDFDQAVGERIWKELQRV